MRLFLLFVFLLTSAVAEWDFDGKVGIFYQHNTQVQAGKDDFISDVRANLKFNSKNSDEDVLSVFDFDTIYDPIDSSRRYFLPTEAKIKFVKDNYDVEAGLMVLSWGVMDVFSPVDTFNSRNLLKDPLSAEKLGSLGIKYNIYPDSGEWSIVVKIIEIPLGIPYAQSPYYIFDSNAVFNPDFSAINFYRPTVFSKYTATFENDDFTMDYGLIISNGLDTLRGLTPSYDVATSKVLMTPLLFYSTKLMAYAAVPISSYLFKSEAVVGMSEDQDFSHYAQLSLGIENNIEVFSTKALTLLAEYHKLFLFELGKYNDIDLFQLFQNDMILGARLGFNDKFNSSLTMGGLIDFDYSEYGVYLEYASKFNDNFGFTFKATKVLPTQLSSTYILTGSSITLDRYSTILKGVGDFSAISLLLTYNF